MLRRSRGPRHRKILDSVERYELPAISEADIARAIESFKQATGTTVERSASELHTEIRSEAAEGLGGFLLLAFHLPFGDTAVERGENETGLKAHVRSRYQTLKQPGSDRSLRELSRFNPDLLADVGVMVNLLNASGIGIHPELIHALWDEYGGDIDTHDEIQEIRKALEGWYLFQTSDDGAQVRTTHELWSTLYLRAVAQDHQQRRAGSRRRARSEPRTARCLSALFALFDDKEHREALKREFPGSSVLDEIEDTEEKADEYVTLIFGLMKRWPVLAPVAGTTNTARYDLPATCSETTLQRIKTARGHAHRNRGTYQKAQTEYEVCLTEARDVGDRSGEAMGLNNLGLVAESLGEYENAREYLQQSLEIYRDIGDRSGEAMGLNNLGLVARGLGEYKNAQEYFQQSLEIGRDIGDRQAEAKGLNNLGGVARNLGEYENARKYLQRSLEIYRDIGDRPGEAKSLDNLGVVVKKLGEYENAREYFQQSLEIYRDIGHLKPEKVESQLEQLPENE